MDFAINLCGLIGVGLLAFPVLYAEKYARLRASLNALGPLTEDAAMKAVHDTALKTLEEHGAKWTGGKSTCLFVGTGLAAFSYLLGGIKALFF